MHDGVPRYRNPNNIFLFRHRLGRSEELGITRQTCLPESELVGEDVESAATTAALSLGREVSGKVAMDFSRLVKTSLQSINLDRQVQRGVCVRTGGEERAPLPDQETLYWSGPRRTHGERVGNLRHM